jgi:hypothetical protein
MPEAVKLFSPTSTRYVPPVFEELAVRLYDRSKFSGANAGVPEPVLVTETVADPKIPVTVTTPANGLVSQLAPSAHCRVPPGPERKIDKLSAFAEVVETASARAKREEAMTRVFRRRRI